MAPKWRRAARSPAPFTSRAGFSNSRLTRTRRRTTRTSSRTRQSSSIAAPAAARRSPANCSRIWATTKSLISAASRTGPTAAAPSKNNDAVLAQKRFFQFSHALVALQGEHLRDRSNLAFDARDTAFAQDAAKHRLHRGDGGADRVI